MFAFFWTGLWRGWELVQRFHEFLKITVVRHQITWASRYDLFAIPRIQASRINWNLSRFSAWDEIYLCIYHFHIEQNHLYATNLDINTFNLERRSPFKCTVFLLKTAIYSESAVLMKQNQIFEIQFYCVLLPLLRITFRATDRSSFIWKDMKPGTKLCRNLN